MALLEFFRPKKKATANLAKERLQIIVAERRGGRGAPAYLPELKQDILKVIAKYVEVDPDMVNLSFEQTEEDLSVLELNVTLPDDDS